MKYKFASASSHNAHAHYRSVDTRLGNIKRFARNILSRAGTSDRGSSRVMPKVRVGVGCGNDRFGRPEGTPRNCPFITTQEG
jgi:hypothetical protein